MAFWTVPVVRGGVGSGEDTSGREGTGQGWSAVVSGWGKGEGGAQGQRGREGWVWGSLQHREYSSHRGVGLAVWGGQGMKIHQDLGTDMSGKALGTGCGRGCAPLIEFAGVVRRDMPRSIICVRPRLEWTFSIHAPITLPRARAHVSKARLRDH